MAVNTKVLIEDFVNRWASRLRSMARRYGTTFDEVEQEARIVFWRCNSKRGDAEESYALVALENKLKDLLRWRRPRAAILSALSIDSVMVVGIDGREIPLREVIEDGALEALEKLVKDDEWERFLAGLDPTSRLYVRLVDSGFSVEEVAAFEES